MGINKFYLPPFSQKGEIYFRTSCLLKFLYKTRTYKSPSPINPRNFSLFIKDLGDFSQKRGKGAMRGCVGGCVNQNRCTLTIYRLFVDTLRIWLPFFLFSLISSLTY